MVVCAGILLAAGIFFYPEGTQAPSHDAGRVEVGLGESATALGVTLTPREVREDSRCPSDVQCIQAGRVLLRVSLMQGNETSDHDFLVGEPFHLGTELITLLEVQPAKVAAVTIPNEDYRFIFKVEKLDIVYTNASADNIRVALPSPGAVTGRTFVVVGEARGTWYFEASFPIKVIGANGETLTTAIAQAGSEWMTRDFVPFTAPVTIPESYSGPATLVLMKDNPSGEPIHDASFSFPITIEY